MAGAKTSSPAKTASCAQPQSLATYDQKPEMSAYQVHGETEAAIASGQYDLIVCNYANPDHGGSYRHDGCASVRAHRRNALGALRAALAKGDGLKLLTPTMAISE